MTALLLAGLLGLAEALGAPTLVVEARVDDDLRVVRGTVVATDLEGATWVDPLATLPVPEDALEEARTFPGRVDQGSVRSWAEGDGLAFEARLPRRWGDVGATHHGLFANGAWLPQPLVDGTLPVVSWTVTVRGPEGSVVVVGDVAGDAEATWTGTADRASLAVVPRGQRTPIRGEGWDLVLVTSGRPRPGLLRNLTEQLPLGRIEGRTWRGAVVEAPLRRRLVRPGASLAYVSDRAWRVFPWFRRLHHDPVLRGLFAAWSGMGVALDREVAGALVGRIHQQRLIRRVQVDVIGLTRWLPVVDQALYNREMAFQAELFDRVVPTDPIADDLAERYAPHAPGGLVVAQLADAQGTPAVEALAALVALGWSLADAGERIGLPGRWLDGWRGPYPFDQDYALTLADRQVTVTRTAPDAAPPETVVVDVDGERIVWSAPPGSSQAAWTLPEPPGRVSLDPERHLGQDSRTGDQLPARIRWTLWGQISGINVSQAFASAFAQLTARGAADTRNRFSLLLLTDQRKRLGASLSWTRYVGRIVQPTVREHAFTVALETAWLNPTFPNTDPDAPVSVGGVLAYRWDNRLGRFFPRRGGRVSLVIAGGGTPGNDATYVRVTSGAEGEVSVGPKHTFAGRLSTGFALTDIPQERLVFGGSDGVRGLPDRLVQTEVQTVVSAEYRAVPLHEGSIPLGIGWIRDIQLIAGVDVGVGSAAGTPVAAVGAAGGVGVIFEALGLTPLSGTVVVGVPLWAQGITLDPDAWPVEVYIVWGMMF